MTDSNLESEVLRKKIQDLERENQLLQESGVDYEKRLRESCGAQPEDYDPDQGVSRQLLCTGMDYAKRPNTLG